MFQFCLFYTVVNAIGQKNIRFPLAFVESGGENGRRDNKNKRIESSQRLDAEAAWATAVSFGFKVDDEMGSRYEEAVVERRSVAVDHFAHPYVCMCFCSEPMDSDVLHAWQSSV